MNVNVKSSLASVIGHHNHSSARTCTTTFARSQDEARFLPPATAAGRRGRVVLVADLPHDLEEALFVPDLLLVLEILLLVAL